MIAVKVPLTSVNLPGELFIQDKIKRLKRNVNLTRFNLQNQGKRRKPPPDKHIRTFARVSIRSLQTNDNLIAIISVVKAARKTETKAMTKEGPRFYLSSRQDQISVANVFTVNER